jgi:hypothetical protein
VESAEACEGGVMTTDAVIIGGGFADVTAARELTMRGRWAREYRRRQTEKGGRDDSFR